MGSVRRSRAGMESRRRPRRVALKEADRTRPGRSGRARTCTSPSATRYGTTYGVSATTSSRVPAIRPGRPRRGRSRRVSTAATIRATRRWAARGFAGDEIADRFQIEERRSRAARPQPWAEYLPRTRATSWSSAKSPRSAAPTPASILAICHALSAIFLDRPGGAPAARAIGLLGQLIQRLKRGVVEAQSEGCGHGRAYRTL
jgi:hypothetical protein